MQNVPSNSDSNLNSNPGLEFCYWFQFSFQELLDNSSYKYCIYLLAMEMFLSLVHHVPLLGITGGIFRFRDWNEVFYHREQLHVHPIYL